MTPAEQRNKSEKRVCGGCKWWHIVRAESRHEYIVGVCENPIPAWAHRYADTDACEAYEQK